MHRTTRRALPEHRGLALVRDPDRGEISGAHARLGKGRLGGGQHRDPDLLRVVLDPGRAGKVLRHLRIAAPAAVELLVEDDARRSGGALVDRKDECVGHGAMLLRRAWEIRKGTSGRGHRAGCERTSSLRRR